VISTLDLQDLHRLIPGQQGALGKLVGDLLVRGSVNRRVAYVSIHDRKAVESL